MQQVVVPQFLDVEDKIIGPVTVRQFLEVMVGGMLIVICYQLFDFSLFVVVSLVIFSLTVVVAFAKINGQSFHLFMLNFIQTMRNPKLKTWRKDMTGKEQKGAELPERITPIRARRPASASKISEIALMIDTGGIYEGEN